MDTGFSRTTREFYSVSSPFRITSVPRLLAWAFALYGLIATVLLAVEMPPFQNPDEANHFLRAAQVAGGGLVGTRFSLKPSDGSVHVIAGGKIDPALSEAANSFESLKFHPERRATPAMWAPRVGWSSNRARTSFANTVIYPPIFYFPSAVGIRIGKASGLTIVQTLMISRLLTGVAATAVGVIALDCAGAVAVWLFTILTLPMSLSLIASSSQDALMVSCGALAASLMMRCLWGPQPPTKGEGAWLVVMLSLVAIARPPYVGLALLPFALGRMTMRWRFLAALAIVSSVAAWSVIAAATSLTDTGAFLGANPAAQMSLLLRHPLLGMQVGYQTLAQFWRDYLEGFIGRLGYLDTALPASYRAVAEIMLGTAALATMLRLSGGNIGTTARLVIASAVLLSAGAVFAIQYLTWTPPGGQVVEGVQGRYFLPLALVAGAALPSFAAGRWGARLHDVLVLAVVAFPVVTIGVMMRVIVLRYYLG